MFGNLRGGGITAAENIAPECIFLHFLISGVFGKSKAGLRAVDLHATGEFALPRDTEPKKSVSNQGPNKDSAVKS